MNGDGQTVTRCYVLGLSGATFSLVMACTRIGFNATKAEMAAMMLSADAKNELDPARPFGRGRANRRSV